MPGPEPGLATVVLKTPEGARAEVCLHGAHLISWKVPDGKEVLFVSDNAIYKPPKAIRGGVPVCFPQFGKLGSLQQHGFARNVEWALDSAEQTDTSVTFMLNPTQQQYEQYGYQGSSFVCKLKVSLLAGGSQLKQELVVINTGDADLSFTSALHTYFAVSDIDSVGIEGLTGVQYLDAVDGLTLKTEEAGSITIASEIDRIYMGVPRLITLSDKGHGHKIELHLDAFPDAVLWNPWQEKAQAMSDFGDEEYRGMVCIEAAVASSGPLNLPVGGRFAASQLLKYVP